MRSARILAPQRLKYSREIVKISVKKTLKFALSTDKTRVLMINLTGRDDED